MAACVTPGSELTVEHVYVGPGRAGFLDVLRRMGAAIELSDTDPTTNTATIVARYGPLLATNVGGREVASLIDEIPVLAVAAACAEGTTTFSDAAELRLKESDRVASVVAALRSIGVDADPRPDGLTVHGGGGRPLAGGTADPPATTGWPWLWPWPPRPPPRRSASTDGMPSPPAIPASKRSTDGA